MEFTWENKKCKLQGDDVETIQEATLKEITKYHTTIVVCFQMNMDTITSLELSEENQQEMRLLL